MKWPELVPPSVCTTLVEIRMQEGLNLDGSPKMTTIFRGKCNYTEKTRSVLDARRQLIELHARALFNGDVAPGKDIAGELVIEDSNLPRSVRCIHQSSRGRNPDGTVNFTQLELI